MSKLAPLTTLSEQQQGERIALPDELSRVYGSLYIPYTQNHPYVIGSFVQTIDGVVDLKEPGYTGGGPVSGSNEHDRMILGLLRALADVVIVASGTMHGSPKGTWTAERAYPAFAEEYTDLRKRMGKKEKPLVTVVTASGNLDTSHPILQEGEIEVLVITTSSGKEKLERTPLPSTVKIASTKQYGLINAKEIISEVRKTLPTATIAVVEGGPHLMGTFFDEHCLDEIFLTISPQVAGRSPQNDRPGLVADKTLAPHNSVWSKLADIRQGGSYLFLRYAFQAD